MCGFAGIFHLLGAGPIDRGYLEQTNTAQAHRGPDDTGTYVEAGVGLSHQRLSIIDRAGGQQPLFNEDGAVVVVYNGEIYNYPFTRRRAEREGASLPYQLRYRGDRAWMGGVG